MHKLLALLAVVCFSACRCELTEVDFRCPLGDPCVNRQDGVELNPDSFSFRGECHAGTVAACQEDGTLICEGQQDPVEEECNLADDDCDGRTDEDMEKKFWDPSNDCPRIGVCTYPTQICVGGVETCEYPFGPHEEQCNGDDDDCDGQTDEGLDAPVYSYPTEEFPGTVGVGECSPQVTVCENSRPRVTAPVTPVAEIERDCLDNDCDGLTDEDDDGVQRAFVLVIDRSGSMQQEQNAINTAACSWALNSVSETTQFAVVYVGYGLAESYVSLVQDFSDAATTCATLVGPVAPGFTYGSEHMLDGVSIADQLGWPEGERAVLAFTDESLDILGVTVEEIEEDCTTSPYQLGVFVNSNGSGITNAAMRAQWQFAIDTCDGFVEGLVEDANVMEELLHQRFAGNNCD
jgi:hypothetical protein